MTLFENNMDIGQGEFQMHTRPGRIFPSPLDLTFLTPKYLNPNPAHQGIRYDSEYHMLRGVSLFTEPGNMSNILQVQNHPDLVANLAPQMREIVGVGWLEMLENGIIRADVWLYYQDNRNVIGRVLDDRMTFSSDDINIIVPSWWTLHMNRMFARYRKDRF